MQHKGEIVEKVIRESGYPITRLAKKLGKSPRWMYYMFDKDNVSIDHILEIGKILHYDFSEQIKDIKTYKIVVKSQEVEDPLPDHLKDDEIALWKNKYLELLEKHNQLLSELTKDRKINSSKK